MLGVGVKSVSLYIKLEVIVFLKYSISAYCIPNILVILLFDAKPILFLAVAIICTLTVSFVGLVLVIIPMSSLPST